MVSLMQNNWTVTLANTFLNEALSLPKTVSKNLTKTVKKLERDPIFARGDAKKLKNYKNLYRVRLGDYRLIYAVGKNSVKLLSVRKRNERTYELDLSHQDTETPDIPLTEIEVIPEKVNATIKTQIEPEVQTVSLESSPTKLPKKITKTLLKQWKIPQDYWSSLLRVESEDDLLNQSVPHLYIERILDNLFPRSLEEISSQPEYKLFNIKDIERFLEGDITGFLLRLDPEQERLINFNRTGPILVKGGPGTGKSTLALYRVQKLLETGCKSILFTTYTNALVNYSEQLIEQLLKQSPAQVGVKVATVDALIYKTYTSRFSKPHFANKKQCLDLLEEALNCSEIPGKNEFDKQVKRESLKRLGVSYLLEEILNVIQAWGIKSLDNYLQHKRQGRGVALQSNTRTAIWMIYQTWQKSMKEKGWITWEELRCKSLEIELKYSRQKFDAVIIDEAQDLSPVSLRFLLALTAKIENVYLTADASQSVYQRGFNWTQIHGDLKVAGRTIILKRNYRNTQQIATACEEILAGTGAGDEDCIRQKYSPYLGNWPTILLTDHLDQQAEEIAKFLMASAKQFRLPLHGSAVLCPNTQLCESIAQRLQKIGLNAKFVSGKKIDLKAHYIKVLTLHSAKGLEFPFIAVMGLQSGQLPHIKKRLPIDEIQAELDRQRRLFYVGCTRAMRALAVCGSKTSPSQFLDSLLSDHWTKQVF